MANSGLELSKAASAEFGLSNAHADVALARDPAVGLVVVSVKVHHHRTLVETALAAGMVVSAALASGRWRPSGKARHRA